MRCATLTKQNCSRPCANMPLRRNALAQVCPCAGYDWYYKTQMGLISRMWYAQNGNSTAYRPHEHSGHTNDGTRHMAMEPVCPANLSLPSHTQTISQMRHTAFPEKRPFFPSGEEANALSRSLTLQNEHDVCLSQVALAKVAFLHRNWQTDTSLFTGNAECRICEMVWVCDGNGKFAGHTFSIPMWHVPFFVCPESSN